MPSQEYKCLCQYDDSNIRLASDLFSFSMQSNKSVSNPHYNDNLYMTISSLKQDAFNLFGLRNVCLFQREHLPSTRSMNKLQAAEHIAALSQPIERNSFN